LKEIIDTANHSGGIPLQADPKSQASIQAFSSDQISRMALDQIRSFFSNGHTLLVVGSMPQPMWSVDFLEDFMGLSATIPVDDHPNWTLGEILRDAENDDATPIVVTINQAVPRSRGRAEM
jgi:hypothetical protein